MSNFTLRAILAAVLVTTLFTANPAARAQSVTTLTPVFEASGDLAVGPNGDIFVANFGTFLNTGAPGAEVYRVTPEGEVSVFATGFSGASGNTFDADGNLFQSSIAASRISRVAPDGTVTTVATGIDGLRNPVGLAFDSAGTLFVANCGNRSILAIAPDGTARNFITTPLLSCPNGLTIDDDDNLYAANFNNGNVVRITPDATASLLARTPGGPTKLAGSNGHIVFGNERLYVVSNAAHQVFELTLDGTLTLLAGSGVRGRADGPALEAEFALPNGIDLSPDGRILYVNDSTDVSTSNNNIAPNVVRAIVLSEASESFAIQSGMTGAWFNPETPGQGMLFDVNDETGLFFAAWFTFEDPAVTGGGQAGKIGSAEHRWFTAQGAFSGATADLPLLATRGGVFDAATEVENVDAGRLVITFDDCETASVSYVLDDLEGSFPLVRLTPNAFCRDGAEAR